MKISLWTFQICFLIYFLILSLWGLQTAVFKRRKVFLMNISLLYHDIVWVFLHVLIYTIYYYIIYLMKNSIYVFTFFWKWWIQDCELRILSSGSWILDSGVQFSHIAHQHAPSCSDMIDNDMLASADDVPLWRKWRVNALNT